MRRLVPVSLVALLLLSGCVGLGGMGGNSTAKTVDPSQADLPPGVNASGVTNASALVEAHNESLCSNGFVMNGSHVRDLPNSGNITSTFHTAVAPKGNRFLTDKHTIYYIRDNNSMISQRTNTSIWGNSTPMGLRADIDWKSVVTGTIDNTPTTRSGFTGGPQYLPYLENGNFTVGHVVERVGHTYTTLIANDTSKQMKNYGFNATFIVDELDIVHKAVIDIDNGESGGTTSHAEYHLVKLGASPKRPDWVDNASNHHITLGHSGNSPNP